MVRSKYYVALNSLRG